MYNYIIRRIFQAVIVVFVLSFVCYVLMALMPGDPVDLMASSNPKMTPADVARLKAMYGLDLPIYERYFNWLSAVFQGDLGYSRTYKVPVSDLIGPKLLNTFILSVSALIVALLISVPLGIYTALRQNSKVDYLANLLAFAGQSIPAFWLGIMLILIFAVQLKWFPAGGTEEIMRELTGVEYVLDRMKYLALPVLVFTVAQIAIYVRYTRGAMVEVMRADFIRTARAKGLDRQRVIWVHALRNALLPLITIVALGISGVFSGAVITEQIFAYQGVGYLLFNSIQGNDFNVAMVSFNITTIMVVFMNLVADLSYALVDPRISYK